MTKPNDIDETASRANDQKSPEERARGNRGGRTSDGKDGTIPTGGRPPGPGRSTRDRQPTD